MTTAPDPLPIETALPDLIAALRARDCAVLIAPPGAGKTTRVPLALAEEPWVQGRKILVLEPRRLAARAAAARMATLRGENVGDTVGLRIRFGSQVSRHTRIEVITEGVFTRLVLDDPTLDGVAAVLFDEFHERSLDTDLGLALARDAQRGLREDLKLVVMSATIDGARVAALLDGAPVIESHGRSHPVRTVYAGRDPRTPIERQVATVIARALREEAGSVLAFLPGAAEIRRTEALVRENLADTTTDVVALFGALDTATQQSAIAPAPPGRRKIVLATGIAETSLTIEGVRIVVDCGLARVPRFEPGVGLTRLDTVRVSRASADQRRGRAGRTEPGVCYRLWDEAQTGSLEPYARPEILSADLSSFVLDLAHWGVRDPDALAFLDPPPAAALDAARTLLRDLEAIDVENRITAEGRRLRLLPLPPRLAKMVIDAGDDAVLAAEIAAILTERGLGGDDVDLRRRLEALARDRSARAEEARRMANRWAQIAQRAERDGTQGAARGSDPHTAGALLALAYPERIARNRGGGSGAFLLANGRGAAVDPASPLAREPFLAVGEIAGTAALSRVLVAAPITPADIETLFGHRIAEANEVLFDADSASLKARQVRRLGAVKLLDQPHAVVPTTATATLLAEGIAAIGIDRLPWTSALRQWRDRVRFLRRAEGEEWPDVDDEALTRSVAQWLAPALSGKTARREVSAADLTATMTGLLPYALRRRLDSEAPTHFEAPTGSRLPIDYGAEDPKVSIRVQELFGLNRHPTIAGGRVALVIELLSPGHRPVQITRDLPGFWRGSYAAVRSEMRGRYPKHPWPDDPLTAPATRRAKPRGS